MGLCWLSGTHRFAVGQFLDCPIGTGLDSDIVWAVRTSTVWPDTMPITSSGPFFNIDMDGIRSTGETVMNVSGGAVKVFKLLLFLWIAYVVLTARIGGRNAAQWQQHAAAIGTPASVTLVIAHPDDEVMFFSPALLQLDRLLPDSVRFNFVCLSKGDADHLGETRELELRRSLDLLMSSSERERQLFQFDYPDGFNETWAVESVVSTLESHVFIGGRPSLLLTFDAHGVSNHPNHVACYNAVTSLVSKNQHHKALLLDSHNGNYPLKYSAFAWELVRMAHQALFKSESADLTFMNSFPQYVLAFAAMSNAHESQLVWFRYGWWSLSRFVFVNDLKIVI